MKTNIDPRKSKWKNYLIIFVIFLFCACLLFIVLEKLKITNFVNFTKTDNSNINSTIKGQEESGLPVKTTAIPSDSSVSDAKKNATTPANPPEKPNLTRAEQTSSNLIKIVATLNNSSDGYCEAQISNDKGELISKESYILISSTYYACTFSFGSEALSSGQWQAKVVHHIGESQTSSDVMSFKVL